MKALKAIRDSEWACVDDLEAVEKMPDEITEVVWECAYLRRTGAR